MVPMDKEKDRAEKKSEQSEQPPVVKEEEEKPGFPEDVDFKKFLGCGG